MFDSPFVVPIVLFVTIGATSILYPIARALARRMEHGNSPAQSAEITARLERMEQAIDSIAVEVERISEGQRFTTRLLSERVRNDAPVRDIP
jgi:hypothetical protein